MSSAEQPTSTVPVPRTRAGNVAGTAIDHLASALTNSWKAAWANEALRTAITWSVVAWCVLMGAFVCWVHFNLEGVAHRALLPGTYFGLPEREAAAGFGCVSKYGYDGQQYYWMSNDIFGRHDAVKHLDEPLYRYQRIGVPMLAGGLATVLGYPLTPTPLYFALEFAMTSAGFGALVYWLKSRGMRPIYALGWLLATGTLFSLWVGVLDGPADALFVFSILAVFSRRLAFYVPVATLMLLTRETYAIYAFGVFVVTVFGKLDWQDVSSYRNRLALAALPGIVMLGWTAYLALHFQMSPLAARKNPGLKSWPFYMMYKYATIFFDRGNLFELRLLLVTAFSLILVGVVALRNFRRLPIALACALPLVLMNASTGQSIWEAYGGSTRMNGSIIILGIFLMSIDKTILLKFMVAVQMLAGLDTHAETYLMNGRILSPQLVHHEAGFLPRNPPEAPDNLLVNDMRSSVEWVDAKPVCRHKYHGPWSPVHREVKAVQVAVTNHSDVAWEPGMGKHPIFLAYRLFNANRARMLGQRMVVLPERVAPGETAIVPTFVELRQPGEQYVVEFSMFQNGPGWFMDSDPSYGSRYEITVE